MGIVSLEQADHLYWLGRYTERVYTTLRLYCRRYDEMLDKLPNSYQEFCRSIDIPNIYASRDDFFERYPFDETVPDSLISNLYRAYDNAIVLRGSIGSEALSYVQMAIYELSNAKRSDAPMIEMQKVLDLILAFWGIVDDQIHSEQVRNIIKAGKRIERIDLYARSGRSREALLVEVHRLIPRVEKSGVPYHRERLEALEGLLGEAPLPYGQIIADVEGIF